MLGGKVHRGAQLQGADGDLRGCPGAQEGAGSTLASQYVLGMRVDATSYEDASQRVARWAVSVRVR
jgi:hypothetical protein